MIKLNLSLALCLLLVSCDSGSSPPPKATTSPHPVSTAFVNGGECVPSSTDGLPEASGCVTEADGLIVYALLRDDLRPRSWRMRTGTVDQVLSAGNAFSYPRAIGGIEVDGNRAWFVKTFDLASHGTNWQQLGLFVLVDGHLRPLTYEEEPLAIRVGGISRMGEGANCDERSLTLLRVEADNRQNTRWSYSARTFSVRGTRARFEVRRAGRLLLDDYNDPKLDRFYAVNCNGFSYP